MNDRWR
jgi:hypothetical protein